MNILMTGISGRFGRRVASRLSRKHRIIGVDPRRCPALPKRVEHHHHDIRHRPVEDLFRRNKIDAVLHLGTVHNFRISPKKLYERNVMGTEVLLKHISKYNVGKLVLLSSGDVYGPMPTNSHYITEDAPLMATQRFPEIRTMVAVDRTVQTFFWKHPDIETVILRPAHIVGPHVRNAPSNYLRLKMIPRLMGFDPIIQLLAESDLIAMLEDSLRSGVRGILNVAGTEPLPLSRVFQVLGKPTMPVPYSLFKVILGKMWQYRMTTFPAPELDHIRFHAVLDTSLAKKTLGVSAEMDLYDILAPFRPH
ncbi:MAG: NAD-dependent epimerase [Myxococcales bacterium]|nr:NAD-dependent epimerase [Myxococcales bacterium]